MNLHAIAPYVTVPEPTHAALRKWSCSHGFSAFENLRLSRVCKGLIACVRWFMSSSLGESS